MTKLPLLLLLASCAIPSVMPADTEPVAAPVALASPMLATAPLAAAKPKNLPIPGTEFVPTPGTTAKAVVAYQAACVHFVELLQLHNEDGFDLPVLEDVDEAGKDTGEIPAWADLKAKRGAIK